MCNYNKIGIPRHMLNLKINDTCIALRNINKKERLTNNSRVLVIAITPKCIRVQTLGDFKRTFSLLPFGRSFELE